MTGDTKRYDQKDTSSQVKMKEGGLIWLNFNEPFAASFSLFLSSHYR